MVDLVITPASVVAGSDATTENGIAGVAITAGQQVWLNAVTGKYELADSNSATVGARRSRGTALHAAALNQPLSIQKAGNITIGATLVAGTDYYLSDTPGGICPRADIGVGEYVCLLGLAKSTTVLALDIQFPNVSL